MDRNLKLLKTIHYELAKHILDLIKSGEAKAGDLNVARQFLKDNGIECIPVENNPMEDLMNNLPDLETIPPSEL
jgi:ABC-type Zn uptake system ZnuABC Zn-binding protein ZnuA|tara:strand:+ start:374 stop:595 length:222 start_codon:yes stop_codon:yes gene_type:complete